MKTDPAILDSHLEILRLPFIKEHCQTLATAAAKNSITHFDYLAQLIEGEAALRADRAVARRIHAARFPVIKTLDTFRWDWPKKINRLQIQDLFRLQFVHDKANVIFLGTVGLGKTHLATALGHAACQQGISVLFANAIDVVNTLSAAQLKGTLKTELRRYTTPSLVVLDEVGYADRTPVSNETPAGTEIDLVIARLRIKGPLSARDLARTFHRFKVEDLKPLLATAIETGLVQQTGSKFMLVDGR